MNGIERRMRIIELLTKTSTPISASKLGTEFGVSRQLIVGDVAILRAESHDIIATARGYILNHQKQEEYTIICKHGREALLNEIYTIVDSGCGILDVMVEHSIYGTSKGVLNIFSRKDADAFALKLERNNAKLLCEMIGEVHMHTITCPSEEHYQLVVNQLREKGLLFES